MKADKQELEQVKAIEGAGGGKGGGSPRVAQEAPNTLASRAIVRVIDAVSEGEIEGLVGGAKGIYLNDTPLMNSSGAYNFTRTIYDYRVGLPDQPHMAGFPFIESEVAVGANLTTAAPVIRTVSSSTIDSVRITISLPSGLYAQDTSNADLNGSAVSIAIDVKPSSSGAWFTAGSYEITGKTTSPSEKQYLVHKPASATGTFDWRVRRLTADSSVSSLRNDTAVSRVTEIQDIKLPYNDTAYIGLAVDAEAVNSQAPLRSYLIKGIRCKVPTNYNPETRVYTGIWNGLFKTAWTDNPAWCLYDLITHPRYGLGEFITESQVEKYSFYDAAVYNDQLVSDGKGGQEPRFTFNAVLNSRDAAYKLFSTMAGAQRSTLLWIFGQVHLIQDRPASSALDITNANVENGMFDYRSTGLQDRNTAFNVTFNDRTDRYLQRIVTVDASTANGAFKAQLQAAQDIYGYNSTEILAVGAVTEGQAIREGMWALDTVLNQTEIVQFKMSYEGFKLVPGDIVTVFDADYTTTSGGGRIVSVVGTTVTIDREVTLVAGSKIDVMLADGFTIEQRNVVETSGTTNTFTIASAFSQPVAEQGVYIMRLAVEPRQFKVIGIRQEAPHIIAIEAVFHDPNKYARIETGVSIPSPIFSNAPVATVNAPTGLQFREVQVNDASDGLSGQRRSLLLSWVAPTQGIVRNYIVRYRNGIGEWITAETTVPSFEIAPAAGGVYTVDVFGVSIQGNAGPVTSGSYTINTTGGSASALNAPTGLTVIGGGTTYTGLDLNFQFTNPASNANVLAATLRDFEIRFIETTGSTTVRTVYVPPVANGSIQTFQYTFGMNIADGGARRSIQVQVRCRDTNGNLSNPATVTFSNPVPAALTGVTATAGIGNIKISFNRPADRDFGGVMVWRGTTNGFSPAAGNLVYDTSDNYVVDQVPAGTTYYYRMAAYDDFGKPANGSGLNMTSQFSAVALASPGIPEVSALPNPVGYTGPVVVFLTTDQKLYSYKAGAWVATVANEVVIADGYITAPMLAADSVTAGKIAANSVSTSALIADSVTANKLAADSVTADKINVTELSAISANLGTISAGDISGANLTVGSSPALSGTSMTGTGARIYNDGRFVVGNSVSNITFNGTVATLNGFTFTAVASNSTGVSLVLNPAGMHTLFTQGSMEPGTYLACVSGSIDLASSDATVDSIMSSFHVIGSGPGFSADPRFFIAGATAYNGGAPYPRIISSPFSKVMRVTTTSTGTITMGLRFQSLTFKNASGTDLSTSSLFGRMEYEVVLYRVRV